MSASRALRKPVISAASDAPHLAQSMDQAEEVIRRLAATKRFIYDVETTGLDWRKDVIVGHVFTFGPAPSDTYYVPVRHGPEHLTGNIINHPERHAHPFERALQVQFLRSDLRMVGHHLHFDLMFNFGHGLLFEGYVEDTEVNDALLDEFAASHSLEAACTRAGTLAKKGTELYQHLAGLFGGMPERRAQMGNFWRLAGNDPIGVDYAAGDGVSTWHLYERQLEVMARPFTEIEDKPISLDGIRQIESRVTRCVYRMMRRGVKIDEARLGEVIQILETKLAQAKEALPADLNVNSGKQVKELFEKDGITGGWPMTPPSSRFPLGNPSFTEAYLKTTPRGPAILTVRKFGHLLDSFALPMRDKHVFKGRCHATFTQMANDEYGTITGRFSSSNPNLQQVPKRIRETAELIRSFFIPDKGLDWIDADLSQCEPRLLAHYSGSRVLCEGYLSKPPVDAHSAVALAANIDRESGKRLNQTLITGGGRNKIIAMLSATGVDGAKVYDDYFEAMPEVRRLQKESGKRMERRGWVMSLKGRLARLEHSNKAYLAINRLLQCGNADIMKESMSRIDAMLEAEGDEVQMLVTVHDSLALQGNMKNKRHKKQVMEALRIFTDYGPEGRSTYLRVPMAADYGVGRNWAEATYPKEKLVYGE